MKEPSKDSVELAWQLLKRSEDLYLTDPDGAIANAQHVIDTAVRYDNVPLLAQGHMEFGRALRHKADLNGAEEHFRTAVSLFESIADELNLPKALQGVGTILSATGRLEEASKMFSRALPMARAANDPVTVQRLLNSWGIVYIRTGNYQLALKAFEECLDSLVKYPDLHLEAMVYQNMGGIFQRNGDYTIANGNFRRSLDISRAIKNDRQSASCLIFLGDTATEEKKYDEAKRYLRESLAIAQQHGYRDIQSHALLSLAETIGAAGEPNKSIPYLLEARLLMQEDNNKVNLRKVEHALGTSFMDLGQLDNATSHVENSLALAREIGSPLMLYESNLLASHLATKKLDYQRANEYLHEALRQHQILFSESNTRAVREMELRMAIEARNREETRTGLIETQKMD